MNIPLPPEFSDELLEECRTNNDVSPIMFEWFKYVGLLANFYASIKLDSPSIKDISPIHFSVLIGTLNRCSRLILSNVALSHEGLFGETTSIIDRSIFESAVKITWLCKKNEIDNFNRFICQGLKTELAFKTNISDNISKRDNEVLPIEERMRTSISNYINDSGFTEEEINNSKNLPNLAQMINDIGKEKLAYIVGQKIGSHHVHGTWVSLWYHYLEKENETIVLRDHNCETHPNQYLYISLCVLEAIISYLGYIVEDEVYAKELQEIPQHISTQIHDFYYEEVFSKDV